jgi:amidase
MGAYLNQIERLNPKVNAIVALQDRSALVAQARERDTEVARGEIMGPLHGFPHAVNVRFRTLRALGRPSIVYEYAT